MHQFQWTFWLRELFLTIPVTCWPELPSRQPEAQVFRQWKMQFKHLVQAVKSSKPHPMESPSSLPLHRHLLSPTDLSEQDPAMGARPSEALSCNRARYRSQHLSQETLQSRVLPAPYRKQSYRNSLTPPGVQSFLRTRYSPKKIAALFCFSILTLSSKLPSSSFKHAFSTASHGVKPALITAIPVFGSNHAG